MTPYQTIEKLLESYGVRDVLIMIAEKCYDEANYRADVVAGKWIKAGKVVQEAVRKLPNGTGIK